jgi:hypothetical protein
MLSRANATPTYEAPETSTALDPFETLARLVAPGAFGRDAISALEAWNSGLREKRRLGLRPTVLEHVVLVFALRSGLAEGHAPLARKLAFSLSDSWLALAGQVPLDPLQRLPRYVLRAENRETRLFHAAAFQNLAPKDAWRETALGRDFVGDPSDLFIALAGIAIACLPIGRELLAGVGLGYLIATSLEYGFHGLLAHAPSWVNRLFARIGGNAEIEFRELKFSHVGIHHDRTFKAKYCIQFSSIEERASIERIARTRNPRAARDILESRFGNSMSRRGALKGLKIGVPVAISVIGAAHLAARALGFEPGLPFDLSAFAVSLINLPATGIFHAYDPLGGAKGSEPAHAPVSRDALRGPDVAIALRTPPGTRR